MKCQKCGREYPDYVDTCSVCQTGTINVPKRANRAGWVCPRCLKLVDDDEFRCPYCGFENALVDGDSERTGIDAGTGWVRQFRIILTTVTIDSSSDSAFVRTNFDLLGYGEQNTYSKTLWLVLNLLIISLFAVSAVFIGVVGASQGESQFIVNLAILVGVVTFVYALVFYYLTFVPPKR